MIRSNPAPVAAVLWLALSACGGSQAARPQTADAKPALPAIPEAPIALVPGEPTTLLRADLAALRTSPYYAHLARWAETDACARPGPAHWLLTRTQVALLAYYAPATEGEAHEALAILHGDFEDGSARAALDELGEAIGHGGAIVSAATAGRFQVLGKGPLSSVKLSEHMLAVGHTARVTALIEVADGRAPAGGQTLRQAYGGSQWLDSRMVAALFGPDRASARVLKRRLESFGGPRLGAGLGHHPVAAGLDLNAAPSLVLRIGYSEPTDAEAAIAEATKLAWQANLVLRLAGMPPVLDRVEVDTEGSTAELSLKLRQEEAQKLLERAERALRSQAHSRCAGHEA